jgi:hypothetical protein
MKISLPLIVMFRFSVSNAQTVINSAYNSVAPAVQNQRGLSALTVGMISGQYPVTRSIGSRMALVGQGDTIYLVNNAESASSAGPWSSETNLSQLAAGETKILTVQGQGILGGLTTTTALTGASFFQLSDSRTGLVCNGNISCLANIGLGIAPLNNSTSVPLGDAPVFPNSIYTIANYQPGEIGVANLTAVAVDKATFDNASPQCDGCFTVTSVQAANSTQVIHFGPSSTDQQFDANSVMADNPVDRRIWLQATQGNSTGTITSLSLYTGKSQNPGGIDGAINIRLPSGQFFGVATDSSGGLIVWQNYPGGRITLQAETIYTGANIVDSGIISTRSITISDFVGTSITPPLGVQEYILSNSSLGNGMLIQNTSESPTSNTTLTLTQGLYSNTIMTISAYSSSPDRPAGALWVESGGPNGMVLNATDGGTINHLESAKCLVKRAEGLVNGISAGL